MPPDFHHAMIGMKLAHYEITNHLGTGGMGEVYQATDSKLGRSVAIKLLPEAFTHDTERAARFEREARVLASLNHPNIAAIYGLEQSGERKFLVMEFVPGETFAERIQRGPIPLDEALGFAKHIADALEAAHEKGIVHRDLKPANVKITPEGNVKVLDFGLAKAMEESPGQSASSNSPTLMSMAATNAGMILGTASYMAPEQAKGRSVDRRADIWAFGVVLYETLTGRMMFIGDSLPETLAAVMMKETDWGALPTNTPARLREQLRRCLVKDPRYRIQAIGDARIALEEIAEALKGGVPEEQTRPEEAQRSGRLLWVAVAAILLIAGVTAGYALFRLQNVPAPEKTSFELQVPASGGTGPYLLALSPDGRNLVTRLTTDDVSRLWVRPMERVTGTVLGGTEGASFPFWDPSGRYVGFFSDGKLKKVDIFGAPPQTLAVAANGRGGSWNSEGVILFAPANDGPLFRIPAIGGQPVQVTELNKSTGETAHRQPRFLPDGVHFLYHVVSSRPEDTGLYVGSLASKDSKRLVATPAYGEFAAPDLLLFLRENTLMAQRFDPGRMELSGDPFQVAEQVGSNPVVSTAGFSVSKNGVLAYREGGALGGNQLIWVDRNGKPAETVGTPALYENPRLSPDGKRLAVFKAENGGDIWIIDLERGNSTRFTFDPGADNVPVWSPDGASIAFVSNRDGGVFNIYRKNSAGTGQEELLLKTPNHKTILDWSADGRYILYEEADPKNKTDLWVLPLFGDRKQFKFLGTPFNEDRASFSPDGHWIAYSSDESGIRQVYVQSFPTVTGKWQISTARTAATMPRWGRDGKELFYDGAGPLMAVDLKGTVPGGQFKASAPRQIFTGLRALPPHNFDLSPDGKRFLVVSNSDLSGAPTPIVVVLNWKQGLKP